MAKLTVKPKPGLQDLSLIEAIQWLINSPNWTPTKTIVDITCKQAKSGLKTENRI